MPAPPPTPPPADTLPAGARMAFCIGAQKAGTSWLYETLLRSPGCHFGKVKEMHYFDVRSGRETSHMKTRIALAQRFAGALRPETGKANRTALARLRAVTDLLKIYTGTESDPHGPYLAQLLRGYRGQPVICDFTPSYCVLTAAEFAEMAAIGEARFIFVLRDPVARMWSQMRMHVGARPDAPDPGDPAYLAAACARVAELQRTGRLPRIERADYRRTITELERAVPAGRIHYVFYEDLFTQGAVDAICTFLGVPTVPVDSARRVNEGAPLAIPPATARTLRQAFAAQYAFAEKRFGAALPEAWTARN